MNYTDGKRREPILPKVEVETKFLMDAKVAQEFNAYATAALPNEIGGMLRIIEEDGVYRAIELKVFKQEVNSVYFELDGTEVAKFNMELVRAKKSEQISEWKGLIHSHPSMTPFMSGPDRENIERLAGNGFAFSVICSAQSDPLLNYHAVHYAQKKPVAAIVHNIPVGSVDGALNGIDLVDPERREEIQQEVAAICSQLPEPKITIQELGVQVVEFSHWDDQETYILSHIFEGSGDTDIEEFVENGCLSDDPTTIEKIEKRLQTLVHAAKGDEFEETLVGLLAKFTDLHENNEAFDSNSLSDEAYQALDEVFAGQEDDQVTSLRSKIDRAEVLSRFETELLYDTITIYLLENGESEILMKLVGDLEGEIA